MNDIYSLKEISLWLPINPLYTVLLCIIFVCIYFLIFRKNKKNIKINTELILEKDKNYKEIFYSIDFLSMDSSEFIKEVSIFFRDFLENEKEIKNFSKLTLKEISYLDLEENYKLLIEELYFKEYKKEKIDEKDKKRIHKTIKEIILKED